MLKPARSSRISGSAGGDFGSRGWRKAPRRSTRRAPKYRGAQGLDPEFIKKLEKQFGFDKPAHERFALMLWNYLRFDFGKSYFRDVSVLQLIKEKLPVSMSLGIWMTLLTYLISIPLGIRKAVDDGSRFDVWTSSVIIVGYAIPGFLFAILLIILFAGGSFFDWFPLRGLVSEHWSELPWWQKILDYFWHLTLPIISMALSAFATMTLLTKNSFLEEIRKQYVLTARAKGCSSNQVLYGHVFRNAMLIVIAGFPVRLRARLFHRLAADRNDLFARWPRPAGLRKRSQPRLSGRLRHAVHLLAHRRGCESDFRSDLHLDRSAHRFRDAGGLRWTRARDQIAEMRVRAGCVREAAPDYKSISISPLNKRRWENFKANRRGYWALWIFLAMFLISLFAEFIANDKPIFIHVTAACFSPPSSRIPTRPSPKSRIRTCSALPPTTVTNI